jgi:glycosyltransferase involved in cell wall biosynthesis
MVFPLRTGHYHAFASALEQSGLLRQAILGTRNGFAGIPRVKHRLFPIFGLAKYVTFKTLPPRYANLLNYASFPFFDYCARPFLKPGDHLYTSFAYANSCMANVNKSGGLAFLDAGNAHPTFAHRVLDEERKTWGLPHPVRPKFYVRRAEQSIALADYVFSPSQFVTNSFVQEGFPPDRIFYAPYPVDFGIFSPDAARKRPAERPLTLVCTGTCTIRKGTPYLLEAFRMIKKQVPNARLRLCRTIAADMENILPQFADLKIDWFPHCSQHELREILLSSDIFVLPSLEEGLVRSALEAMACDLPAVLTLNSGANDFVHPGVNGEIVPIRDPKPIAEATLKCWDRLRAGQVIDNHFLKDELSVQRYANRIAGALSTLGICKND